MDAEAEAGLVAVMTLSEDARTLWQTAEALALQARAVSPSARTLPPLLFFTDPARTPDPLATAARLPPGAGVVYRHFGTDDAPQVARAFRAATRQAGVRLLIGQDTALAEQVGADGVHLPERDLHRSRGLRAARPDWLVTGAVHGEEALAQAARLDAAVVSPVFQAGGASAAKPALGVARLAALCRLAPCPVYGLGGLTPANVEQLLGTGACGIAGVEAIQAAFSAG